MIKPHLPVWLQDGNKVVGRWNESFVDRKFNRAVLSMVAWIDKKGSIHHSVHHVNWTEYQTKYK